MSIKTCLLLLVFMLLVACTKFEAEPPTPRPGDPNATALPPGSEVPSLNPYSPGKGDESMTRSEVYIDSQEILVLESFPPQFELKVAGSLPTPCHGLRAVVDEPDEQNRIHIEIYSLVDLNTVCTQVLEPFEVNVPLGSYASGTYTVLVNGQEVGQIVP